MQNPNQVKTVVLGASGVGKSCLLLRFVNGSFNEVSQPTLGAAFISKNFAYREGKSVRFQVWDTAGQQKYRSIASIYYRDCQVALCVYDITSKQSFQVLKNWVAELKLKGPPNILMVVVGNKTDRADEEQVAYQDAHQFAKSIGATLKMTSAKEGKGVNQLFTSVAQRLDELNGQTPAERMENFQLKNAQAKKVKKKKCC